MVTLGIRFSSLLCFPVVAAVIHLCTEFSKKGCVLTFLNYLCKNVFLVLCCHWNLCSITSVVSDLTDFLKHIAFWSPFFSDEKTALSLTEALLYMRCHFSLAALKIIFGFWQFDYDESRCGSRHILVLTLFYLSLYYSLNLYYWALFELLECVD